MQILSKFPISHHKKINRLQEIIELQCKDETQYEIFKILIENIKN